MSLEQNQIKRNENIYDLTDAISRIFLSYLTDTLSIRAMNNFYESEKYKFIKRYSPQMGYIAFKDLVNLSKEFLNLPINEIITQFSTYFKNYNFT